MSEVARLAHAGDLDGAAALTARLEPLYAALFATTNPSSSKRRSPWSGGLSAACGRPW